MHQRVGAVVFGLGLILNGCAMLTSLKNQVVEPSAGQVRAYEGKIVAIRAGASEPESLDLDSKVFAGDIIRTLENSHCRIGLNDGTVLTLGERSEMEIRASASGGSQDTRRMVVKVATGLLRLVGFVVPGAGTAVEVVTALASFTFSPTEAIIEVTPTRVSALNLEGTVQVVSLQQGIPGEVVLQPGEGTNIESGKPPTPASRWSAERADRVKQATYLP